MHSLHERYQEVELALYGPIAMICNPNIAKELLDVNFSLITILPCKVAVYLSKRIRS